MPDKMISTRTARPTRVSRPNRTTRRLLKVAGLGVAGLIAGLLAGCSHQSATTLTASHHMENLEETRIPNLRHAPVPHRVHYDATKPSAGHPMPVSDLSGHYSIAAGSQPAGKGAGSTSNSGQ